MQPYKTVALIYYWMPRWCPCEYTRRCSLLYLLILSIRWHFIFFVPRECLVAENMGQECQFVLLSMCISYVWRGGFVVVVYACILLVCAYLSMTRACRQRQRQRHALTACCAIAQVPGSLWQCPDYAPARRLWLAGQSTVCNPCPPRMRCCCKYRTWMTIFVEHACLVHVFDVEGMSLMCTRAHC